MTIPAEAFILAGGLSSRFGSDKARFLIDGKPMIIHVADLLGAQFDRVTVIAKSAAEYDDLGLTTIADLYPEQAPICGLLTALEQASNQWLFLAPCDTPSLTAGTLRQLWDGRGARGAVPEVGGRLHPLIAFYHVDALPDFKGAYERGDYSLQAVVRSGPYAAIPFADGPALQNLNRPPGS